MTRKATKFCKLSNTSDIIKSERNILMKLLVVETLVTAEKKSAFRVFLVRIFPDARDIPYSAQMRKNADQKNPYYGHFSYIVFLEGKKNASAISG